MLRDRRRPKNRVGGICSVLCIVTHIHATLFLDDFYELKVLEGINSMHIVYVFRDQECSICVLFVHSTSIFIPFVSHDKVF